MLTMAAWHLLFRRRETTARQWLALAAGGGIVVSLGAAYLGWVGLLGGERSGFSAYTGVVGLDEYRGPVPPVVLRLAIGARDLFTADWVSWPVLLWFAGVLSWPFIGGLRRPRAARPAPRRRAPGSLARRPAGRGGEVWQTRGARGAA